MRPLWYEFPNNAELFGVDDEFMLGPGILVKPISHVSSLDYFEATFPQSFVRFPIPSVILSGDCALLRHPQLAWPGRVLSRMCCTTLCSASCRKCPRLVAAQQSLGTRCAVPLQRMVG